MTITEQQRTIYNKRIQQGEDRKQAAFAALYWTVGKGFVTQQAINNFIKEIESNA